MNQTAKMVAAIVVTAIVAGGGVYLWQTTMIVPESKQIETNVVSENKQGEASNSLVYKNADLGFSLTVPQKWVDYKYYTETEKTYRFKTAYDGDLVHFYADFSDWKKFELLQVGRTTKQAWETYRRQYNEVSDFAEKQEFWIGNKLAEKGNYVYYYNVTRQDAPNQYVKDGELLPKFPGDFKVLN